MNPKVNYGLQWWWRDSIGLSVVTNILPCWGILTTGEAINVWEQGAYGKSLYFTLYFTVNLKFLFRKVLKTKVIARETSENKLIHIWRKLALNSCHLYHHCWQAPFPRSKSGFRQDMLTKEWLNVIEQLGFGPLILHIRIMTSGN